MLTKKRKEEIEEAINGSPWILDFDLFNMDELLFGLEVVINARVKKVIKKEEDKYNQIYFLKRILKVLSEAKARNEIGETYDLNE